MKKNKILVFNVTNVDNMIYLDLYSFEYNNFLNIIRIIGKNSLFKYIKTGELLYKTKIDVTCIDYEKYFDDISIIYEEINNLVKDIKSKRYFKILNYSSDRLMIEAMSYPDIEKKKLKKDTKYKISKLYYNFDEYYYRALGNVSVCFFTRDEFNKTLKLFYDLNININYVAINYLGVNELFKHYHITNNKDSSIFINFKKDYSQIYIFEGLAIVGTRIINVGYDALINNNEELIKDLKRNLVVPTYYFKHIGKIYYNFEEDVNIDLTNLLSEFNKLDIENLTLKESDNFNILSSYSSIICYLKRLDKEYEYNFPMRVK